MLKPVYYESLELITPKKGYFRENVDKYKVDLANAIKEHKIDETYNKYRKEYLATEHSQRPGDIISDEFTTTNYPHNKENTFKVLEQIEKKVQFVDKTEIKNESGETKNGIETVKNMIEALNQGKNIGLTFAHTTIKDIPLFAGYILQVAKDELNYSDEQIQDLADQFHIIVGPAIAFSKTGLEMAQGLGNLYKTQPNAEDFINKIQSNENLNDIEKENLINASDMIGNNFLSTYKNLVIK